LDTRILKGINRTEKDTSQIVTQTNLLNSVQTIGKPAEKERKSVKVAENWSRSKSPQIGGKEGRRKRKRT
jgi:hypothetical protein